MELQINKHNVYMYKPDVPFRRLGQRGGRRVKLTEFEKSGGWGGGGGMGLTKFQESAKSA